MSVQSLKKWVESREFYELCQRYRNTPFYNQPNVVKAYREIKDAIKQKAGEK